MRNSTGYGLYTSCLLTDFNSEYGRMQKLLMTGPLFSECQPIMSPVRILIKSKLDWFHIVYPQSV